MLIGLLIALIVICAVWWAAHRIMAAFGIGNPVAGIVEVVIVLVALVWLLSLFGYGSALRIR